VLNRTSKTDIGALCLRYGGGGHRNAGTCQIDNAEVETTCAALIHQINEDQARAPRAGAPAELTSV
jgi:nanoRNase/pAp phosphatase (c-di-AMP/oligoRNAs hydrolase)